MREFERKQLLERVEREGATVGAQIPETVDLDGEPFDLREFVFEVRRADAVAPDERDRLTWAKKQLRRERRDRRQRIETGDIGREEGERLVDEIVGLDRALNALESLDETGIAAEAEAKRRADQKRWLDFLRKAMGTESDRRRS